MYSVEQWVRLIGYEGLLRRRAVVVVAVAINITAIFLAFSLPEKYTSSTTVFVEEKNIIEPLMQGAAVPTGVTDRARIASEVIYGRRVMHRLIDELGWYGPNLHESEKDRIADRLKERIKISNVGRAGLIRIEYTDGDAMRVYEATKKIAALFIEESHEAKLRESQAAYEFINKQAEEYHSKLQRAEQQLKEFRATNVDVGNAAGAGVLNRISNIRARLDQSTQELREAEIRKASIERQLSGEAESAFAISREGQYRTRISELRSQLETLRLSYHDTHPDIVRIRHQIDDLQQSIQAEQTNRQSGARQGATPSESSNVVIHNPVYQQLRQDLAQTKTLIDMLTARIQEARRQLNAELDVGRQVHGGEATLAELTRDYEVNRTLYQDLSRRRETARVSMNLDRERQGLRFRLQEEAYLPQNPTGFRFLHIVLLGMVLSIVVPVALLFVAIQFDARLRVPQAIAKQTNVTVIGVIPHFWLKDETQKLRKEVAWGALALSVVLLLGVGLAFLQSVLSG